MIRKYLISVTVLVVGCASERTEQHPLVCRDFWEYRAVAPDELTVTGFTAQALHDDAVARFSVLDVTWQEDRSPSADVFTLAFSAPTAFREVVQDGELQFCGGSAYTEVDVPVTVESADGEVNATGTATFVGFDLDAGDVYLNMELPVTVTGAHAAEIAARFDDVTKMRFGGFIQLSDEPPLHQSIALSVWANLENGSVSSGVYRCYTLSDPDCLALPGAPSTGPDQSR